MLLLKRWLLLLLLLLLPLLLLHGLITKCSINAPQALQPCCWLAAP